MPGGRSYEQLMLARYLISNRGRRTTGGGHVVRKGSSRWPQVLWGTEPDEHDYPAAADYLALLATAAQISEIVAALKKAPIVYKKAKDLLRASRLALLPTDNPHVARISRRSRRASSSHRFWSSAAT